MAFYLLLTLYAIEYIGIYKYFSVLKALHLSTLLSFGLFFLAIVTNSAKDILAHRETKLLTILVLFTFITMTYAIVGFRAYQEFRAHLGYFFLFVASYYLVNNLKKLNIFLFLFILYHDIILILNVNRFSGLSRHGGFKAGYFFGDGNDMAWGLLIVLPFTIYFLLNFKSTIIKAVSGLSFVILLSGILGTSSRGAFLALIASLGYLGISSKKKVLFLMSGVVLAFMVVILAPEGYFNRIETIRTYDQDSSARGRFVAWRSAIQMAIDYPFGVGGGNFSSAYGRFYRDRFSDPTLWASQRWISPHSIFFSILAEYGILGLILLISLLYGAFKSIGRLKKSINKNTAMMEFPETLLTSLNMTVISYTVAGVFLGGINYPHLYVVSFLVIRVKAIFNEMESGQLAAAQ